jgi:uncharacterized protein Yka (UPF0111/DUF47 family)
MGRTKEEISEEIQALLDAFHNASIAITTSLEQFKSAMETASEALELLAPYLKDLEEEDGE